MPVFRPVITPESLRSGSAAAMRAPKNTVMIAGSNGVFVIGMPKIDVARKITRYDETQSPVQSMPIPRNSVMGLDRAL